MKMWRAIALVALIAGPAFGQAQAPVPQYGDINKARSPEEIRDEKERDAAYKRSLGNIPDAKGPSDPWGGVRNDSPAKPAKTKNANTSAAPK